MKTLLFYVNDFHGLGHITRTLRIVNYLASKEKNNRFIVITNKRDKEFTLQKNVEIALLPSISVDKRPRDCRYLEKLVPEIDVWVDFLKKEIQRTNTQVFYSDLNPSGGYGELRVILPWLKNKNIKTIIGLRDILDDIEQTKKEWFDNKNIVSIYDYNKIIVWGEEEIFNEHYKTLLREKEIHFPGYVLPRNNLKKNQKKKLIF